MAKLIDRARNDLKCKTPTQQQQQKPYHCPDKKKKNV